MQISNIKKSILEEVQSLRFIGIAVFIRVTLGFVQYTVISDEHRGLVENFIQNNALINSKVGVIDNISLVKMTSFGVKLSDKNAYKQYIYKVNGKKSKIRLVVTLEQKNDEFVIQVDHIKDNLNATQIAN